MLKRVLEKIVNEYFKGKKLDSAINKVIDSLEDEEAMALYEELRRRKTRGKR